MINNTTYTTTIGFIEQNSTSFKEICELNQYNMMNSVQKYPKIIFYLALTIFLFLFIDRIIIPIFPKLHPYILDTLIKVSSALSLALLFFITLFTFNITQENYNIVQIPIYIFSIILIGLTIYTNWSKIKQWIKTTKKEEL
jgi:hypothetical protein